MQRKHEYVLVEGVYENGQWHYTPMPGSETPDGQRAHDAARSFNRLMSELGITGKMVHVRQIAATRKVG